MKTYQSLLLLIIGVGLAVFTPSFAENYQYTVGSCHELAEEFCQSGTETRINWLYLVMTATGFVFIVISIISIVRNYRNRTNSS